MIKLISFMLISLSINTDDGCYIHNPVCGTDGLTYFNSCKARESSVRIAHHGKCTNAMN